MSVFIEIESDIELPFQVEKMTQVVIDATLKYVNCPYETEVNLLLTTSVNMQQFNKEHRGIDKTTDVLSFPMLEPVMFDDFSKLEEHLDVFHPETGELVLGDIIISLDQVLAQAEEYGHKPKREFAFLIAHGMFHLLGYDHESEDESQRMEKAQKELLDQLKILR